MAGKERYEVYRDMMNNIPIMEKAVTEYYAKQNRTLYSVFFSICNEDGRTYFCDIEVGNPYCRIYGEKTEAALRKHYNF